jgi:hypothetical protein
MWNFTQPLDKIPHPVKQLHNFSKITGLGLQMQNYILLSELM